MKPIEFPEQNLVFKADGCMDLPAHTSVNEKFQTDEVTSCWEFSEEDITNILRCLKNNERTVIYLSVIGGQPPVSLFTK